MLDLQDRQPQQSNSSTAGFDQHLGSDDDDGSDDNTNWSQLGAAAANSSAGGGGGRAQKRKFSYRKGTPAKKRYKRGRGGNSAVGASGGSGGGTFKRKTVPKDRAKLAHKLGLLVPRKFS